VEAPARRRCGREEAIRGLINYNEAPHTLTHPGQPGGKEGGTRGVKSKKRKRAWTRKKDLTR